MRPMTPNDPETLLAETRAFNAELERLLATMPSVHTVAPEQTRRARRQGLGIYPAPVFLPQARTVEINGPSGPVPLRISPEAPHGFISLPMTVADAALSTEHDFLRRTLSVDPRR